MIDFTNWHFRNDRLESPDFDWRRWQVTMDTFWQPKQKPEGPDFEPRVKAVLPATPLVDQLVSARARVSLAAIQWPRLRPRPPDSPPAGGGIRPPSAAMVDDAYAVPMHHGDIERQ